MKTNLEKLKNALSSFNKKKGFLRKLKKIIFWLFISGVTIVIIILGIFLYFYFNWQSDRDQILKQAELYNNQILKETSIITHYKSIGSKDYKLENVDEPIRVYDAKGELLGEFTNERRRFVSIDNISPYFFYALFATEDKEFYNHSGINYKAIFRAMLKNILAMKFVQGGSTLTQQLSKILFTDRKRNLKRKIYEFFCAKELEKIYTKDDILLMYSNLILLGHGAYGVEYASQLFFKKNAKNLTIGEASFLVGLISNPTRYSPFLHRKHSRVKHKAVLNRMVEVGYIQKKSVKKIFKKFWNSHKFIKKDLQKGKSIIRTNYAPYVLEEVRRFIVKEFGEDFFIKNKGASIYTTIDKNLQLHSKNALVNHLKYLNKIAPYKVKQSKKRIQGAVLLTTPKTGAIKVLIGGEAFITKNQFNRALQAKRQVGSSLKPFLYLSGMENKTITPYDVYEDKPVTIEIEGAPEDQKFWQVHNYNDQYRGYVNLTEALSKSINVVAAKVADKIGVEKLNNILREGLRLNAKEADKRFPPYQYSLALGATEMSPLEINNMFMVLANDGKTTIPYLIEKIKDNKARIIYNKIPEQNKRVVSREANYLVVNMMRYVLRPGGTAGHLKSAYALNFDMAGKTGTTQDYRDAWFNGFNPSIVGTIWIGHDDNLSLGKGFTGGSVAAPLWGQIMKEAQKNVEMGTFKCSDCNLITQPVSLLSGKVPKSENDKYIDKKALFIEGTEPGEYCNLSEIEKERRAKLKGWIKEEERLEQDSEEKKPANVLEKE